jgi:hypothetical protein
MKTITEKITPQRATEYLAKNSGNRGLRPSHVDYLAEQIASGHWQVSPQGIAFSDTGRLLDGQHRLAAIVQSGISVEMRVTTGCHEDTFKVLDGGLKRAIHERAHLVDNAGQNALICRLITAYCRYGLRHQAAVPISMIEEEFLRYADSWLWGAAQFNVRMRLYGIAGVLSAIAIYHSVDKNRAADFWGGYSSGEGLAGGSPVLALRRSIEYDRDSASGYWRAMSAIKADMDDRPLIKIFPAAEDIIGNNNSFRLIAARREKNIKGVKSRADRKAG